MTTTGPLNSPIARAIDAHVASLGGTPLRYRMQAGRALFWVSINGRTFAAARLKSLADALGVQEKKMSEAQKSMPTDLIDVNRAAAITGYSPTMIHRYANSGKLKSYSLGNRKRRFSKAELESWITEHRKQGGQFLPRRRRSNTSTNGAAKKSRFIHSGGSDSGKGFSMNTETHARLMKFIDRWKGTPMETTARDFVSKLVAQALDKLGA